MQTSEMEIRETITKQRVFFASGITKSYDFRIRSLNALADAIKEHQAQITEALYKDLHKSEFESYATEIALVLGEIKDAVSNLRRWMRPQRSRTPLLLLGSRSRVISEPYGVVLIMAPWNYPFQLLFAPLVGAIAAGNCAILKPSPQAAVVCQVIDIIVRAAFDPAHITMAHTANNEMAALLAERFDYIFYTGGAEYGRQVMLSAAQHLTPITLELGGKSPCVVADDANLAVAARRIVWGKFLNAGQTCVAPDYILVQNSVKTQFIELLCHEIRRQFGTEPRKSPDFARIISTAHCRRLAQLMECGQRVIGGEYDIEQRYIAPTILTEIREDSELMKSEIFGPLLPVIGVDDIEHAICWINSRDKPLALYCFTESRNISRRVVGQTSSGGVCINDVVVQVANTYLPFGGVGLSGIGSYHSVYSFRTFSHQRAIVRSTTLFNIGFKFAPYGSKVKQLKKIV